MRNFSSRHLKEVSGNFFASVVGSFERRGSCGLHSRRGICQFTGEVNTRNSKKNGGKRAMYRKLIGIERRGGVHFARYTVRSKDPCIAEAIMDFVDLKSTNS